MTNNLQKVLQFIYDNGMSKIECTVRTAKFTEPSDNEKTKKCLKDVFSYSGCFRNIYVYHTDGAYERVLLVVDNMEYNFMDIDIKELKIVNDVLCLTTWSERSRKELTVRMTVQKP